MQSNLQLEPPQRRQYYYYDDDDDDFWPNITLKSQAIGIINGRRRDGRLRVHSLTLPEAADPQRDHGERDSELCSSSAALQGPEAKATKERICYLSRLLKPCNERRRTSTPPPWRELRGPFN